MINHNLLLSKPGEIFKSEEKNRHFRIFNGTVLNLNVKCTKPIRILINRY